MKGTSMPLVTPISCNAYPIMQAGRLGSCSDVMRILYMLLLVCIAACAQRSQIKSEPAKTGVEKYIPVTVIDYRNLDGCDFLLVKENGERLQPLNLADSLKKEGLKIRITYTIEESMGICMAGKMVRITRVLK